MGGLAEGEHAGAVREEGHDGGRVEGVGDVLDASCHDFNGIVEPSGETFTCFSGFFGVLPSIKGDRAGAPLDPRGSRLVGRAGVAGSG
ncbi:hypothetical protein GCM10009734_13100 [Nonomuraea bangladeshensis]